MSRRNQGFTIIELIIAITVLAILTAITIVGLEGLRPRAALQTSVADLVNQMQAAKRTAVANGSTVWVGLLPAGADVPLRYVVYEDWNGNFDPDTFDPSNPNDQVDAEAGTGRRTDRLLALEALPETLKPALGTAFGSLAHVPVPFRTVDPTTVDGCSFCDATGGWIRFLPRGDVRIEGSAGTGGGLFLTGEDGSGDEVGTVYFISITEPFGLTRSFSDA